MGEELSAVKVVTVTGVSNREFLETYARAGRVGLAGGATLVDLAIRRAERLLDEQRRWSRWSHAFVFQGARADGRHWVIESDLEIAPKHIRLGAQENRVDKFWDEKHCPNLAVLDFGLAETQLTAVLQAGLELIASRAKYSMRELLGTLVGLRAPRLRGRANLLARDRSMFCSALVHHLFQQAGVDLAPGVDGKHTTPEDIARSPAIQVAYLLVRTPEETKLARLRKTLRSRLPARLRRKNPPK